MPTQKEISKFSEYFFKVVQENGVIYKETESLIQYELEGHLVQFNKSIPWDKNTDKPTEELESMYQVKVSIGVFYPSIPEKILQEQINIRDIDLTKSDYNLFAYENTIYKYNERYDKKSLSKIFLKDKKEPSSTFQFTYRNDFKILDMNEFTVFYLDLFFKKYSFTKGIELLEPFDEKEIQTTFFDIQCMTKRKHLASYVSELVEILELNKTLDDEFETEISLIEDNGTYKKVYLKDRHQHNIGLLYKDKENFIVYELYLPIDELNFEEIKEEHNIDINGTNSILEIVKSNIFDYYYNSICSNEISSSKYMTEKYFKTKSIEDILKTNAECYRYENKNINRISNSLRTESLFSFSMSNLHSILVLDKED